MNIALHSTNSIYSNKINPKNVNFSGRLQSSMQDEFHITGSQIRIRSFLEHESKGLSDREIAEKMFPQTFAEKENDEDKQMVLDFMQTLRTRIKKIDDSFKKLIPSLMPKTYYRGVVGSSENRAIKIVNEAKVGDVIQPDLGYPFLASKLSYAEEYSQYLGGDANPENCVVMIIKTPIGTPISRDISFNTILGDKNVVLPRGVKYEVLDKEVKNNKTYITLKYLNCATDEENN